MSDNSNKTGAEAGNEPTIVCESDAEKQKLMLARSVHDVLELEIATLEQEQRMAEANPMRTGVFVFSDGVTDDTIKRTLVKIRHYSLLKPGGEITLVVNSNGGSVRAGLALYDELEALKSRGHVVTVYVRGWAASMGGILLQSASDGRRFVGANSFVLIHQVSYGIQGNVERHSHQLARIKRVQDALRHILMRRSNVTLKEFNKLWSKPNSDCWLTAEQSVELGFADGIA